MAVTVMQRYEMKYLLSGAQTDAFRRQLEGHMQIDEYGQTSIASLYYDTPDARLIRASLEKPEYKEKLRLRSYGLATETSPAFLELKRKYDGVVYKRRVQSTIPQVGDFFAGKDSLGGSEQIRVVVLGRVGGQAAPHQHVKTIAHKAPVGRQRVPGVAPLLQQDIAGGSQIRQAVQQGAVKVKQADHRMHTPPRVQRPLSRSSGKAPPAMAHKYSEASDPCGLYRRA